MRGNRPLSWMFDFIGEGNQSRNYELIEAVQPVMMVDGINFPVEWQLWAPAAQNIINGTVTTPLPVPPPRTSRLWVHLWVKSNGVGTTGADYIDRSVAGGQFTIITQEVVALMQVDIPLIGGQAQRSSTSDAIRGYSPQVAHLGSALQHRHSETVPAGAQFTLRGVFVDLPVSAPFAARFLS